MTENKRFTLTFDDKIVDNLTGIIHDVHSGYDVAMDLSGLLNDLSEDNEQLKSELNKLSRENRKFEIFIQRLYDIAEENGSLSKCRAKAEIQWFREQC